MTGNDLLKLVNAAYYNTDGAQDFGRKITSDERRVITECEAKIPADTFEPSTVKGLVDLQRVSIGPDNIFISQLIRSVADRQWQTLSSKDFVGRW